jgi:hypothetical protein
MEYTDKQIAKAKEIKEKALENNKEKKDIVSIKFYTHYCNYKSIYVEITKLGFDGEIYRDVEYDCIDENGNNLDCRNSFNNNLERNAYYAKMNELVLEGITYDKNL